MADVQAMMWRCAGLFRTRAGLREAVGALDAMVPPAEPGSADGWKLRNLLTVARLIAGAALRREESRGAHFRDDFPERDDSRWRVHVVDTRPR
jgi:L-aspartate oxidase